jgi:hypothetical protein
MFSCLKKATIDLMIAAFNYTPVLFQLGNGTAFLIKK